MWLRFRSLLRRLDTQTGGGSRLSMSKVDVSSVKTWLDQCPFGIWLQCLSGRFFFLSGCGDRFLEAVYVIGYQIPFLLPAGVLQFIECYNRFALETEHLDKRPFQILSRSCAAHHVWISPQESGLLSVLDFLHVSTSDHRLILVSKQRSGWQIKFSIHTSKWHVFSCHFFTTYWIPQSQ